MKPTSVSRLSTVGLVLLALLAVALSVTALFQHRDRQAPSEAIPDPSLSSTPIATTETAVVGSAAPQPTASPSAKLPNSLPGTPTAGAESPTVVVIGDGNSTDDGSAGWPAIAAEGLQWSEFVNLSSAGRGFYAIPRSCNLAPCSTFAGSIDLIVVENPDVVITSGGAADGDVALGEAATAYFESLREALPDAELIAISPVTGADEWPYFMTMHQQSIRTAVEGVGGTMIDVGRIGLGEETLSAESHAEIAQIVIDELG